MSNPRRPIPFTARQALPDQSPQVSRRATLTPRNPQAEGRDQIDVAVAKLLHALEEYRFAVLKRKLAKGR